jgi:hypothetical protein
MNQSHALPVRFYFALPRLLAMLRDRDSSRAEQNGIEAWVGGIAIYLVGYLFFAGLIPADQGWWGKGLLLVGLAFLVWLFWLLVLYLNSVILKLLRGLGLFRALPARRGQSILVGAAASGMAFELIRRGGLIGELGAVWLIAVAMNLAAAVILAFRHGSSVRP